ncbi:MAG TPA: hypothetical protein QF555_06700 [Candidatus Thalassarchaeaceae archaeon]|nr:hypothetical protein [Candidatus Thalassarchaeaceae archaeon]
MRDKALVIILAFCFILSGCIGGGENTSDIEISVDIQGSPGNTHYIKDSNNGTSIEEVEVNFDFTGTESSGGAITEFWLEPGDGSQRISVNAAETKSLMKAYESYGVFVAKAGANDSGENSQYSEISIKLAGVFHLNETSPTGVDNPANLHIDAMNSESTQNPSSLEITSTITNVENLAILPPPDDVEITWQLFDPTGELIASHTQVISDGESYTWTHNVDDISTYNQEDGGWELIIEDAVDEENVNQQTTALVSF